MAPVVFLIAVLTVVAVAFAAQAADDLEAETTDSLNAEPADSLGAEETDESAEEVDEFAGEADEFGEDEREGRRSRPGGLRSENPSMWLLNTHPKYDVSITKRKEVTNWDAKISLQRRLSEKLSLKLNATLHTRENSTLNRSDSKDGTSAKLSYTLNDNIRFGLLYNSSVNAYRQSLDRGEPADRKTKQDVTVSSQLSKQISDVVDIKVNMSAGSNENSYASVRKKGGSQNFSASLSFTPVPRLETQVNYTGKQMLFDSAVDSGGVSVFTSEDRTFSQDLVLSASYDLTRDVRFNFDASQRDQRKQYPDTDRKQQETEERSGRRASVATSVDLFERVTWDVSVDFSESAIEFDLRDTKNSMTRSSSLSAGAKVLPWRGATISLGGDREISRSEYATAETGQDVHKSLSLNLNQNLGPKADLSMTALTDLVSVFYDNKEENPKDRDRLSNRLTADLSYSPTGNIATKLGGEFSEEQSVYVKAASSANNRTATKYRVSGTYDIKRFHNVAITQTYDISAVYTQYHFGTSENTLVRNSNVQTKFVIPGMRNLRVTITHNYKFQDQGSYRKEGSKKFYGKAAEKESHVFTISCNAAFGKFLRIVATQAYQIQKSWTYDSGEKLLDYVTASAEIRGKITLKYDIGDKTSLSLSVQQNRKEGSRVNRAFKSYRNIEFEASHVF